MTNSALAAALRGYEETIEGYVAQLEEKGLAFAPKDAGAARIAELRAALRERGAEFRNGGASIRTGWLSQACVECTGNRGSETFSTTFKCHRDCYFCFNCNLADYQKFFDEGCPWEEGLADAVRRYKNGLACVGLTGGEPLLNLDDSLRFLQRVGKLFPGAHRRMYTSGDLLTEEGAARLRDVGLNEIRFSVKVDDPDERRERVLQNMALAARYIPDVMVEMPIIPGTRALMEEWFKRFAENGIKGINLLEFCFPFNNWDEFAKRGFELRNPPFDVAYDYGYSGGLAVAGSEELALELMLFGLNEGVPFGMHYCSLENKHRSEMRQMNEPAAQLHPCFTFDEQDFFLKAGKVFGADCAPARAALKASGCADFLENDAEQSLTFPLAYAADLRAAGAEVVQSVNILEKQDGGRYIRELALKSL